MNKLNPLAGITLGGFQVFDEPTYIPLDRLTLIFGPNSAGKSAVQDAIDTVKALEADKQLFSEPGGSSSLWGKQIRRHRRKVGEVGEHRQPMLIYLKQNIVHPVAQALLFALGKTSLGMQEFASPFEIESRWTFPNSEFDYEFDYELRIESEMAVRFEGLYGQLSVNLRHPIFNNIQLQTNFVAVQLENPDVVGFNDGCFTFTKNRISGFHPCGIGVMERGRRWLEFAIDPSEDESCANPTLLREALAELSLLVGYLTRIVNGYSSFNWRNVPASRQIPTRSDLTFRFGGIGLSDRMEEGDERYRELASSLAGELQNYSFTFSGSSGTSNHFSNCINRALGDHLFLENGYRVAYDYRVLLSKEDSIAAQESKQLHKDSFSYLIELHLRDGRGRKLRLEDVGSGIGYVLPVLCAVYGDSGQLSLGVHRHPEFIVNQLKQPSSADGATTQGLAACFIQQPELHLHPALQAALTDVFIESSNAGMQLLIETHSEHLLLRLLKRIRQTHLQIHIAKELTIGADAVCVLYFQPTPDGTTKVKHLRISEDGEFMDRWPRGFFPERDQELQDE